MYNLISEDASPIYMITIIIALLAALIAVPSALATWYSRCFKISLLYGFIIVFSQAIAHLILYLLGDMISVEIKDMISNGLMVATAVVTVIGVYYQFTSSCDLGYA